MKKANRYQIISASVIVSLFFIPLGSAQEDRESAEKTMVVLRNPILKQHPIVQSYTERGLEISGKEDWHGTRGTHNVYLTSPLSIIGNSRLTEEFIRAVEAYQSTRSVEITVHMIEASRAEPSIDVPDSLREVVDTLQATFGYANFRLLETALIRGVSGSDQHLSVSGTLPTEIAFHETLGNKFSLHYMVQTNTIELENRDEHWNIAIPQFYCNFEVPRLSVNTKDGESSHSLEYRQVGVTTALQLREGQQVVVGKSNIKTSSDALFVVVSARVAD